MTRLATVKMTGRISSALLGELQDEESKHTVSAHGNRQHCPKCARPEGPLRLDDGHEKRSNGTKESRDKYEILGAYFVNEETSCNVEDGSDDNTGKETKRGFPSGETLYFLEAKVSFC